MPMRVLVTGGRDYRDAARVAAVLQAVKAKHGISAVIQGGARGADQLCAEWAWDNHIPVATFNPDWANEGKSAGITRNIRMLAESRPDCCIAFPGGTGTAHMLGLMLKSGLPLWVIE